MKIKPKEIQFLALGLIIGLVVGLGASATGLFGTAVNDDEGGGTAIEIDPSLFYLVEFEEAEEWLEGQSEADVNSDLEADLERVRELVNASDAGGVADSQGAINNVLLTLHNLLLKNTENIAAENFATCIGLNRDPYGGAGVFLYLEVPQTLAADVPQEWEAKRSDKPQESGILWSAECYRAAE